MRRFAGRDVSARRSIQLRISQADTGCWIWLHTLDKDGYGKISNEMAHRRSYEAFVGQIPEGMQLDHLCKNTRCVNPKHLEPVTNRENVLRSQGIAAENFRKTHCKHGHPLFGENLYLIPNRATRQRDCRICRSEASRRRAQKRKEMRL